MRVSYDFHTTLTGEGASEVTAVVEFDGRVGPLVTCASDAISPADCCSGGDRRFPGKPGGTLPGGRRSPKIRCHRGAGRRNGRAAGARTGTAAPGYGTAPLPGCGGGRTDLR